MLHVTTFTLHINKGHMSVSRRYMVTVKSTEERAVWRDSWDFASSLPHKFIVFQEEKGDESGYLHYQMYMEFERPIRPSAIKKALGNDVHVEKAIGTPQQCLAYCSKEDTRVAGPWRIGELHAEKMTTSDMWAKMRDRTVRTTSILEAAGYSPLALPQVEKARKLLRTEDTAHSERKRPFIHVIYGPPRAGKTEYVKRLLKEVPPTQKFWASKDAKVFFEGYEGQLHCIIDECDKDTEHKLSEGLVLGILDDTPCTINIKFGVERFTSEHVWFIGNRPICDCYLDPLVSESIRERVSENGEVVYITKETRDALPQTYGCSPSETPSATCCETAETDD